MADRWEVRYKSDGGCEVLRNGAWYSDVDDEYDAKGLLRGQRVSGNITVVEPDGYRRTTRL